MSEIDKALVRRRFAQHFAAYERLAVVQRQIAAMLAGKLLSVLPEKLSRALEVGCGTGFLTREILHCRSIEALFLNDLVEDAPPALRAVLQQQGHPGEVVLLPGDAEQIVLPAKLDGIFSASTLQWFDDLPLFFRRAAEALLPGGCFAFNLFGPENLHQIKALTGMGLRSLSLGELEGLLLRDFQIVELCEERYEHCFDEPRDVLRHLQQTGVTGTGGFRWSKRSLREFERAYQERYTRQGQVVLSWHVFYAVCKKREL